MFSVQKVPSKEFPIAYSVGSKETQILCVGKMSKVYVGKLGAEPLDERNRFSKTVSANHLLIRKFPVFSRRWGVHIEKSLKLKGYISVTGIFDI